MAIPDPRLSPGALAALTPELLEVHARTVEAFRLELVAYARLVSTTMDAHLTASNLVRKLAQLSDGEIEALGLPEDTVNKIKRVKAERGERPLTIVGL